MWVLYIYTSTHVWGHSVWGYMYICFFVLLLLLCARALSTARHHVSSTCESVQARGVPAPCALQGLIDTPAKHCPEANTEDSTPKLQNGLWSPSTNEFLTTARKSKGLAGLVRSSWFGFSHLHLMSECALCLR